MTQKWLWILTTFALCCGRASTQADFLQQNNNIEAILRKLLALKYCIMICGIKVAYYNQDELPSVDGINHLIENNISFKTLGQTFPRFSLLVPNVPMVDPGKNILVRKLKLLLHIIVWNMRLCRALWLPTKRTELVNRMMYCLDGAVNAQTCADIDKTITNQLAAIERCLNELGHTLSASGAKWASSFKVLYTAWQGVDKEIARYEQEKDELQRRYIASLPKGLE